MTDSPPVPGKRADRRKHVIDARTQVGTTLRILLPVAAVSVMSSIAVLMFIKRDDAVILHVADLQRFLLVAHAIYFVLLVGVLTVSSLVLLNRWAGPAYVLRLAIEGMREGDYDRRLKLREADYLKDVADRLASFRAELVGEKKARDAALRKIEEHLEKGDVEAVRRIVAGLRQGGRAPRPEREAVHTA